MHLWSMQPKPATDSPDPDANSDKVAEEQDSDGDRKPEKTDKADTEMHEAHEQADVVEHVDCARSACSDGMHPVLALIITFCCQICWSC